MAKRPTPDSKQSLQHRVAELEAALQSIATKLDDNSGSQDTENDAARTLTQLRAEIVPPSLVTAQSAESSTERNLENAPVLSLFNNSILSRFQHEDDDNDGESDAPPKPDLYSTSPRINNIRRTLLALFPPEATINAVLSASQSWWHLTQSLFPQICGAELGIHIKHFIAESRASSSVQKIAKALLCISGCLQEAPSDLSLDLGQSMTASDLAAHYLNVIHNLVTSDDELVGTIDGVECLFLQCKNEINDGRIRRGWITVHRALSFSQLLGLHIWPKTSKSSETTAIRGQSLWMALYQCDRFLSLLLGLPYAVAEIPSSRLGHQDVMTVNGPSLTGEQYLLSLSNIIGHIIDRNSEPPSNNTLPSTIKIEGEMTDLAALMPSEWWACDVKEDAVKDQMYSRVIPQFWHYQARTLLHLPFMLKAATDRRYEYNKIAALESAREMLQRYRIFRPAQGFSSTVCKVVDFQVFTAAMVLVLNLLSLSQSSTARDQREAAVDEELICSTHDLLHRASLEGDGGVTTQATKALKMFCKARADPCPIGQKAATIVIPYFGTVVFGPGKNFSNKAYLKKAEATPAQLPTPETESLDSSYRDPSSYDNLFAAVPTDFQFGGFQLQEPSYVDMNAGLHANMNQDLDQDWSWFWNNTDWNQT